MTFLPIVDRELRVASRKRSTVRTRWWAALIAVIIGFIALAASSGGGGRGAGRPLFDVMTGYAFGLCILAGVFLTADSLTEEKREGTLGLLFLTDLKGYDVVLGKFMAQWMNAFYALLAILPITALPLLAGGVRGVEFWRTALALANTLFFALGAGICVSACAREAQRVMGNTVGLLLLLVAGLPALAALGELFRLPTVWKLWGWLSPWHAFRYASEFLYPRHAGTFWGSLGISHLFGWGFLGLASFVLPRVWQQKTEKVRAIPRKPPRRAPPLSPARRAQLLTRNPVLWLRANELRSQWGAWAVVAAWAVAVIGVNAMVSPHEGSAMLSAYWVLPFGFLLKLLFGLHVCRFFADGRRNGTLELLMCTPLTNREIVSGQARALWQAFQWPLILFVLLLFLPVPLGICQAILSTDPRHLGPVLSSCFLSAFYALRFAADLYALCWFGSALGLTMKKPALATAYTILFVLLLPTMLWWCDILVDLFLISWGVNKCQQDLRKVIAAQYQRLEASGPVARPDR